MATTTMLGDTMRQHKWDPVCIACCKSFGAMHSRLRLIYWRGIIGWVKKQFSLISIYKLRWRKPERLGIYYAYICTLSFYIVERAPVAQWCALTGNQKVQGNKKNIVTMKNYIFVPGAQTFVFEWEVSY